jgi:hypothetical protein
MPTICHAGNAISVALHGIAACLTASSLFASGPAHTLRFDCPTGTVGSEVTVRCYLDFPAAPSPLAGWQFGVCHDGSVDLIVVEAGSATLGLSPFFNQINMYDGGFTVGVAIDIFGAVTLSPGSGYELNRAVYVPLSEGTASVFYCDDLGEPQVETLLVVPGGATLVPLQLPGEITIGTVPPFTIRAENVVGAPGQAVSVAVELDSLEAIDGISFGVQHDASLATLDGMSVGSALAALNGGAGPDFLYMDIAPTGGGGGTFACVMSLDFPVVELDAGLNLGIALLEYQISSTAPDGANILLAFAGTLGVPAVALIVAVDGIARILEGEHGSISVDGVASVSLIRGDSDANGALGLADAIQLANYLFAGGPGPTCEDAADANDNGAVAIDDVIFLLNYLFVAGPVPPAPGTACGVDPTLDSLACVSFGACP